MSGKNKKLRVPYASKHEIALCVIFGCIAIAAIAVLCNFTSINPIFSSLIIMILYLCGIVIIDLNHKSVLKMMPRKSIFKLLSEEGSIVIKNTLYPVVAMDRHGTILWYNDSMRAILSSAQTLVGESIEKIFNTDFDKESFTTLFVSINDRRYKVEGFKVSEVNDGLYIAMLTDITALSDIEKKYEDERVAIAYITIDNIEDALQFVHEDSREIISEVENKLFAWAKSMGGILRSYDNEKYIMIFESMYIQNCIDNRFDILDVIRDTRVKDSMSVTISMGIAKIKGTLAQREMAAREAIDMALQRGGDQVVYKTDSSIDYYGGRTKSVYKRSNVRSRTFTSQLLAQMARADNVIIMGHRYGDFDSFGASVGVARLAMLSGVKTNIAIDIRDKNLESCIKKVQEDELYTQVFVDNAEGLDLINPDTLVVLVDHNTFTRAQFADIVKKVKCVAVIDHHRKIEKLPDTVRLEYIEPSSSSSCELVCEMLECVLSSQNLSKEVANMLLAGILLDTKQFTRNTGTRTFGTAQYLRGAGANPTDVYDMFKTLPEDLSKEARFHTSIITYKGNIAISACDGETDESYRVIASKAADKMLTLRGIEAAFTLVRIGDQIHISGRSNGNINVQLILEKLNGGGHFDVAGAQVISDSVVSVLDSLKASIDDYLDQ